MEAIDQLKGAEIRAISDSSIILIHRPLDRDKNRISLEIILPCISIMK